MSNKGKKKRGRPKGNCNELELTQRHTAAVKTGSRSKSVLTQTGHVCKKDRCPEVFPCQIREDAIAAGGGVRICPKALMYDPAAKDRIQEAILSGDPTALAEIQAVPIAALHQTGVEGLRKLQKEGLAIGEESIGKNDEIFKRTVVNPRAKPVLKIAEMMGWEMSQQGATPKSSAERKRDESAGGLLSLMQNGKGADE